MESREQHGSASAVSRELMEAMRLECGMQCSKEEETTLQASFKWFQSHFSPCSDSSKGIFHQGFQRWGHLPELGLNFAWGRPKQKQGQPGQGVGLGQKYSQYVLVAEPDRKELDLLPICTIVHIS